MDMSSIIADGWKIHDSSTGLWKNSKYPNVFLCPAQILKFLSSEEYKKGVLLGKDIMDVFFRDIFKAMP